MPQSVFQGLARATDPRGETRAGLRASKAVVTAAGTSEAGIGALMPWNDKLYAWTYPDVNGNGAGTGLWVIGDDFVPQLLGEYNITSAARIVFANYLFIGNVRIDTSGNVTPITGTNWIGTNRIAAYAKVGGSANLWALTMDGNIWSIAPSTAVATFVASTYFGDGSSTNLGGRTGVDQPHGKAAWGHPDGVHLLFTLNGNSPAGRLASFNIQDHTVASLDPGNNSWVEVAGCYEFSKHIFATGTDSKSGLLWLFSGETYSDTPAQKFRIPLPSDQQIGYWQQEWMRIRQVQTERYLLDLHGGLFQLSTQLNGTDVAGTDLPRLEPICRHATTFDDFTFWNGHVVFSGDQTSMQSGNLYPNSGQPQSGLLFVGMEDLWSWGEPQGVGSWFESEAVTANTISDLMLFRGYKRKGLSFANDDTSDVTIDILVYGRKNTPRLYDSVTVQAGKFAHFEFPDAFGADWIAIRPQSACASLTATLRCNA